MDLRISWIIGCPFSHYEFFKLEFMGFLLGGVELCAEPDLQLSQLFNELFKKFIFLNV